MKIDGQVREILEVLKDVIGDLFHYSEDADRRGKLQGFHDRLAAMDEPEVKQGSLRRALHEPARDTDRVSYAVPKPDDVAVAPPPELPAKPGAVQAVIEFASSLGATVVEISRPTQPDVEKEATANDGCRYVKAGDEVFLSLRFDLLALRTDAGKKPGKLQPVKSVKTAWCLAREAADAARYQRLKKLWDDTRPAHPANKAVFFGERAKAIFEESDKCSPT